MQLQALQQTLQKKILQNNKFELKEARSFAIPLHTVEVKYNPVIRSAMDILMKMMLITFKKTPVKDVELVAGILFVEPLFIKDLTDKMVKIGLLNFDEFYQLTFKGEQQLSSGIFEDELEETTQILQYSALHQQYLQGDLEEVLELDEFPPVLQYAKEQIEEITVDSTIKYLQSNQLEIEEDEQQTFITSINETNIVQINDIPCLQYILYDPSEDRYFTRIFNVFTNRWDETLENLLQQNEITQWRDQYK